MELPELFVTKIVGAFDSQGRKWLQELDSIVQTYLEKWKLRSEGTVENLSYNYVLKVIDEEGNRAILKIGVPGDAFTNEIRTLEIYDGKGCVKLLKADSENGVMLIEHLLPGTMLIGIEEQFAIKHFAKVWTAIRRPYPSNENHPLIQDWVKAFDDYIEMHSSNEGPIPTSFIQLAQTYVKELIASSVGNELLHGDLHHENILYSERYDWIAIDPKGVVGDSYFDFTSFLMNQLQGKDNPKRLLYNRVKSLCEELQLDKGRLLKACVVMATLSACWGIEDNDSSWTNAYQYAKWFEDFK